MNKPSLPKGTRDFGPDVMIRRNYIFGTIRATFERYGFRPLETPSMENLETLTGKYGDEGDQLIFKILNNGDFLKDIDGKLLEEKESRKLVSALCDRALRYDLTVPFARFVVMNQHELAFPFRRYQIQPVWRADRPQKGRYREFYQCDADVIGSDSLLSEVELIQIYDDALTALRLPSFAITLNNRKVLAGLAELAGISDRMMEMTIAIDKLDKIGLDGVRKELTDRGFEGATVDRIIGFFDLPEGNEEKLNHLSSSLAGSVIGLKGVEELKWVLERVALNGLKNGRVEIDATLARGLNYYTGAILEVKADNVQMGSIGGGGRYDDLTGIFGLPGMSGVGISFGADRIYDVMSELNLFPESVGSTTRLLLVRFSESEEEEKTLLKLLHEVRQAGISTELYPDTAKLRKQFKYADDNRIPFTGIVGEDELKSGQITIKDMRSGTQQSIARTELIHFLTHS
jgi:histidyl-tRNA synthetase